jgi:hypothetical protein
MRSAVGRAAEEEREKIWTWLRRQRTEAPELDARDLGKLVKKGEHLKTRD